MIRQNILWKNIPLNLIIIKFKYHYVSKKDKSMDEWMLYLQSSRSPHPQHQQQFVVDYGSFSRKRRYSIVSRTQLNIWNWSCEKLIGKCDENWWHPSFPAFSILVFTTTVENLIPFIFLGKFVWNLKKKTFLIMEKWIKKWENL